MRNNIGYIFCCVVITILFFWGCGYKLSNQHTQTGKTVYIAGSSYSPYEKKALDNISSLLVNQGYKTYMAHQKGIGAFIEKFKEDGKITDAGYASMYKALQRAIFCHELFNVVEATDCFVFNMNGRVPDEGGVFLSAVAFSAGRPVVIYKNDHRAVFHGNNNSMIDGCSWNYSYLKKINEIPEALQAAERLHQRNSVTPFNRSRLPFYIQLSLKAGNEISDFLNECKSGVERGSFDPDEFLNIILRIVWENFHIILEKSNSSSVNFSETSISSKKRSVYCSGGLFSPEEINDMKQISDVLESKGYQTYLPQRDGVEAFVMNNTNGYMANSIFARPLLKSINKQIFALDVFQIIEVCDYFVFNMNGRVPDEGGVVELAIAMMHGKPIVIYKDDLRTLHFGIDHPILMGAGFDFRKTTNIENIPESLCRKSEIFSSFASEPSELFIQSHLRKIIKDGSRVQKRINCIKWAAPENKMWTP